MTSLLRSLVPDFVLRRRSDAQRAAAHLRNSGKTAEDVFTDIYAHNRWGGAAGEFHSGPGSADSLAVSPYIEMVATQASSEGFLGRRFVDLGCGDFEVGQHLTSLSGSYIGVDVVRPLVERNQARFGNDRVRFVQLDIASDPLPPGEVCFVRQVLQHLGNEQIAAVLAKLRQYRWVFITEHYPADDATIVWNVDKTHGADIRIRDNSGVYLTHAPFNVPADEMTTVLTVPGSPGVIRTFLYRPRPATND